ncbi:MAG: hypothetical protein PSX36_16740 [bacterium]|nr:hypothetical protein [bacterium]
MNCKFRVFRVTNDRESCKMFKEGYENVLKEYELSQHSLDNMVWMQNPNVYCVVAELPAENKMIGGVRLQVSDNLHPLNLEMAVGKMNKMISKMVDHYRNTGGVAEVDALWHSKRMGGSGISILLLRSAVSLFEQLKVNTLLALCADYSLDKYYEAGFREPAALVGQCNYPYPTQYYSAKLVGVENPEILRDAETLNRERIRSLWNYPKQSTVELAGDRELEVTYDLLIA